MINKKILSYDQNMLCAWLTMYAGCSSPEYFGAHKGSEGLELQQVPQEYCQLLDWFRKQNFESYLELGVGRGGSFLLNVMFQPNLKWATAIDNSEYWKDSQKADIEKKVEWLKEQGKPIQFFDMSTDKAFEDMYIALNPNQKIDCIFIDANHSYEGVKKDFDNALEFIKDGGYIIFHDIASVQCPGVMKMWERVSPLFQFIDKDNVGSIVTSWSTTFIHGHNCGIGIIQVKKYNKNTGTIDLSHRAVTTEEAREAMKSLGLEGTYPVNILQPIEKMMLNKSKYGVLLIETRPEVNLEEVAERHMKFLPESWGLTIIGSKENEQVACAALNRIHVNIKEFNINIINRWLTSPYFWALMPHEKVLVIQPDSQLLRTGIEEFLPWDYIGAPWKFCNHGGNGGLSLRTVEVMKKVCEKHIYSGEANDGNEDIFFSNRLHAFPSFGKLAPREVCEKFSCESIFQLGTLGEHAASKYVTPEEYQQIINQYK